MNNTFRETLMQAPVGIIILRGAEFIVESANTSYLEIIDKKEDNVVGKSLFDSLPEVRATVEPLLTQVMRSGEPFYGNEFEVPLNRHGKVQTAYFNFIYKPFRESDGHITGIIVVANDVTLQVVAKHRLQENETILKNIIESSPFAMTIFRGPDFVIEMANNALLKNIWKRSLEEVQGKKLLDVFPELAAQQFPQLLRNVLATGETYRENEAVAIINTIKGDEKFYLDFEYAPLFGINGEVSGVMVNVHDVTEKVIARNKINDAEQSLRLAVEAASLGSFDWKFADPQPFVSRRVKEIFGYSADDEVTHQELLANIHPDDFHIRNKAMADAERDGDLKYEVRVVWRDKSVHWIRVFGKMVSDNGKPYRTYGTINDITEQKNSMDQLTESEAKFRLLADTMPQLVWTGDANGKLNYFNTAMYEYAGLSNEDMLTNGLLQIVHADERDENKKAWQESVKTGKDFIFEHRFRRHDGAYRWQLSRATPQRSASGEIQMWVGTSTDIHDHKLFMDKLEIEVQKRTMELTSVNQALMKSNNELAQFAYVTSHDLQEPLRKIQTFISRISELDGPNLSDRGREYFNRTKDAASRMQQLILDLLAYSSANSIDKSFVRVDLNGVLEHVLEQLKEQIEDNHAEIDIDPLPMMTAIPFQLEQLFVNLISNSIKYSRTGVAPSIRIAADIVEGKYVKDSVDNSSQRYHRITVTDNGIGFDQQYSERIFQVFQRLHDKKSYEGTGIGLAICKRIVENHRGFIRANGAVNAGASFTIYFPF